MLKYTINVVIETPQFDTRESLDEILKCVQLQTLKLPETVRAAVANMYSDSIETVRAPGIDVRVTELTECDAAGCTNWAPYCLCHDCAMQGV